MSRHFTNLKKNTWKINIKVSDLRHISKKYKQGILICDVIRGWAEVNYKNITNIASTNEFKNQCLWFNSHIRIQNDKMVSKGIILVKDLMKTETCFIRIEKYADIMTVTLHLCNKLALCQPSHRRKRSKMTDSILGLQI